MKIRLFSDLHLEFDREAFHKTRPIILAPDQTLEEWREAQPAVGPDGQWLPPVLEDDSETVLVLAGDIDKGKNVATYVRFLAPRFKAIVYIAGNHEYYKGNLDTTNPKFLTDLPNTHFLQNSTITIDDVEFVGCTLWTDFNNEDPLVMWKAKDRDYGISDYKYIKQGTKYSKLTPERIFVENKKSCRFLEETIEPDKRQVVVTHHAPTYVASKGDPYAYTKAHGSPLYYNTQLDDVIPDAGTWLFGHTHHSFDGDVGGTRIVSNPRGYAALGEAVETFNEEKVIEV